MGGGTQALDVFRRGRARLGPRGLNLACFAAFLLFLAALVAANGLILSRDSIFLLLLAGLLAISASDVNRWARGVVVDWLPFYAALFAYDVLRGFVGSNPLYEPLVLPQIRVDEWLFDGIVPTVDLQSRYFEAGTVHWYDVIAWATYLTHFFAVFVVAAVLWRVSRPRFLDFRAMLLTLTFAAFLTYLFLPAAPPWMASEAGEIGPVTRVVGDVWGSIGVERAQAIWQYGTKFSNQVAALPSLHTAYPVLILCFFWSSGRLLRILCLVYALAMSLTLVYTGEHYVADVILGWLYAGAAFLAVRAIRTWMAQRGERGIPPLLLGRPNSPATLAANGQGTSRQDEEEVLQVGAALQAVPGGDEEARAAGPGHPHGQAQLRDLPRSHEQGPQSGP